MGLSEDQEILFKNRAKSVLWLNNHCSKHLPCGQQSNLPSCLDLITQSCALMMLQNPQSQILSQTIPSIWAAYIPEEDSIATRYALVQKVEYLESHPPGTRATAAVWCWAIYFMSLGLSFPNLKVKITLPTSGLYEVQSKNIYWAMCLALFKFLGLYWKKKTEILTLGLLPFKEVRGGREGKMDGKQWNNRPKNLLCWETMLEFWEKYRLGMSVTEHPV